MITTIITIIVVIIINNNNNSNNNSNNMNNFGWCFIGFTSWCEMFLAIQWWSNESMRGLSALATGSRELGGAAGAAIRWTTSVVLCRRRILLMNDSNHGKFIGRYLLGDIIWEAASKCLKMLVFLGYMLKDSMAPPDQGRKTCNLVKLDDWY